MQRVTVGAAQQCVARLHQPVCLCYSLIQPLPHKIWTTAPCRKWQQSQLLQPARASNQNNTRQQQELDLEVAVPPEQRPVNELAALKEAWLYSWVRESCVSTLRYDAQKPASTLCIVARIATKDIGMHWSKCKRAWQLGIMEPMSNGDCPPDLISLMMVLAVAACFTFRAGPGSSHHSFNS